MTGRVIVMVVALGAAGCGGAGGSKGRDPDAGAPIDDGGATIDGNPLGANPPGPPPEPQLPAELIDGLPKTADGKTIVLESAPLDENTRLGLVWDPSRDDPLAHWSLCLERVEACYQANPGVAIAGCLAQVPACTGASALGCCPAACLTDFRSRIDTGMDEDVAIDETFVHGACVPGYHDQLRAVGLTP